MKSLERDRFLTTKQSAYKTIGHPGPSQVYMHRTDDLQHDIGDGDWFKIAYEGPLNDTYWKCWENSKTDVRLTQTLTAKSTFVIHLLLF